MLKSDRKTELIRLVRKVINGKASTEEKRFVEKYYDYFEKGKYDPADLSPDEKEALANKIWRHIDRKISGPEEKGTTLFLNKKAYRYAAAAAILIAIAGFYFLYNRPATVQRPVAASFDHQPADTDAAPGGNKAVLTLANGSKIVLDSIHKGTLAMQGTSKILKVNNGALVYQQENAKQEKEVLYNTVTTPQGGEYRLTLADGTKVWLNAASSLKFPTAFHGKERPVTLTGEGYFEVKYDKDKPFKVQAGNMEVEDLGTHFNVMAYDDEPYVKTTLLEGSVRITKGMISEVLKPGQQAVTSPVLMGRINVREVNTDDAVAWKNGFFSFHSTSIYEIMKQISRWYNVEVSYRDSLNVFLNGNISRNVHVSQVFKMLELTGEVSLTIKGKEVFVGSRAN